MQFQTGQRIEIEGHGPGTVVYQRLAPPDYVDAVTVSVRLDSQCHRINYVGTIIPVEKIISPKDTE